MDPRRKKQQVATNRMKPIKTEYNETVFRSKMEAKWAEWFDQNEIKWFYEAQGFDINGVWYLPDFYLPEINTIVEVKGPMERIEKIYALYEQIQNENPDPDETTMILLAGPVPYLYNIHLSYGDGFHTNKCSKCGKVSIVTNIMNYACRACGHHDGGHFRGDTLPILMKPIEWAACEPIED